MFFLHNTNGWQDSQEKHLKESPKPIHFCFYIAHCFEKAYGIY